MPNDHVCPWWLAYTFDNPLRRLIHKPESIFGRYIREGMTVMDIGCGMGYFTLALAEMVGSQGRVIAVDLQQKMLDVMLKRAAHKGVIQRIIPHRCEADNIGIVIPADFILAFWMIHEVPDPASFFREVAANLKPAGKVLYSEPAFHVPAKKFYEILAAADKAGLKKVSDITVRFSRATLLQNKTLTPSVLPPAFLYS